MTSGECRLVLQTASVAYDRPLPDALVEMWSEFMSDVLYDEAAIALKEHIAESPHFPTVADISKRVMQARSPVNVTAAWEEVQRAIIRCGWHHEPRIWSSPAVESAVRALGWDEVCLASRNEASKLRLRTRFERFLRAAMESDGEVLDDVVHDERQSRGKR